MSKARHYTNITYTFSVFEKSLVGTFKGVAGIYILTFSLEHVLKKLQSI